MFHAAPGLPVRGAEGRGHADLAGQGNQLREASRGQGAGPLRARAACTGEAYPAGVAQRSSSPSLLVLAALLAVTCRVASAAEPDLEEPETLLEAEEYEGLAEEAGELITRCRNAPESCASKESIRVLGRAFFIKAQALWRLEGIVDGEAIANGIELIPDELREWTPDLPPIPDAGPSPWVVSLRIGVAGQIPGALPGRVARGEQPDPHELPPPPPAPRPPLPMLRLTVWTGAEDFGDTTAFATSGVGLGFDGHVLLPPKFLALAMQLSTAFLRVPTESGVFSEPGECRCGWYAIGGPRLLFPATGYKRPQVEIDALFGPGDQGTAQVGFYLVDGEVQPVFLNLRLNGRAFFRAPTRKVLVGPSLRLQTQPLLAVRRVHLLDGTSDTSLELRWNGHWALLGGALRVLLTRGVALSIEAEAGIAMWGDHSQGVPVLNSRFGLTFGEGQEL